MKSHFDIAKDIVSKKTSWNEDISKAWNTFMVNRVLSMNEDNIEFIDMVQRYFNIPEKNVHEFYRTSLPTSTRFYPYLKAEGTVVKDIKLLCLHFQMSKRDARDYLSMMTEEELASLRKKELPEQYTSKKLKTNRYVSKGIRSDVAE